MYDDPLFTRRRRAWLTPSLLVIAVLLAGAGGYLVVRYVFLPDPATVRSTSTTPPPRTTAVVRLTPALACGLAVPAALDLKGLIDAQKGNRRVTSTQFLSSSSELSRVALMRPPETVEKALVTLSGIALEAGGGGKLNEVTYATALKDIGEFCLPYATG